MEKIKDRKILVTGASGTIGAATTRLLASGGAQIWITGRNQERLAALASECGIPPSRVFTADLTEEGAVAAMAAAIHQEAVALDVLINTAGIGIIKPLEQLTTADFQQSIGINLLAPFFLMRNFLPPMKETRKGLVINIPGILGKTPMAGAMAYSASKYGLNGMMKSLREELKRTDIRITQLFLGGTDTRFWDTIDLRVQREKMILAEEAARTIWFLCQQPTSAVVSEMVVQPFNHQAI